MLSQGMPVFIPSLTPSLKTDMGPMWQPSTSGPSQALGPVIIPQLNDICGSDRRISCRSDGPSDAGSRDERKRSTNVAVPKSSVVGTLSRMQERVTVAKREETDKPPEGGWTVPTSPRESSVAVSGRDESFGGAVSSASSSLSSRISSNRSKSVLLTPQTSRSIQRWETMPLQPSDTAVPSPKEEPEDTDLHCESPSPPAPIITAPAVPVRDSQRISGVTMRLSTLQEPIEDTSASCERDSMVGSLEILGAATSASPRVRDTKSRIEFRTSTSSSPLGRDTKARATLFREEAADITEAETPEPVSPTMRETCSPDIAAKPMPPTSPRTRKAKPPTSPKGRKAKQPTSPKRKLKPTSPEIRKGRPPLPGRTCDPQDPVVAQFNINGLEMTCMESRDQGNLLVAESPTTKMRKFMQRAQNPTEGKQDGWMVTYQYGKKPSPMDIMFTGQPH